MKTNQEKSLSGESVGGLAFALLRAVRLASGVQGTENDAQIWELTEPHNQPILARALKSLGSRKRPEENQKARVSV